MPRREDPRARGVEARRLKRVRAELELSQRQLADHFGVAGSAITQWESGQHTMPGPVLRLLELYEHEMGIADDQGAAVSALTDLRSRFRTRTPRAAAAAALWLLFFGTLQEGDSHPLMRQVRRAALRRYASMVGDLEGLAMKLSQMTCYAEYVLPAPERALLRTLQTRLKPMSPSALCQVFVQEFGKTPRQLFAEWSPKPLATASIGQVHAARLADGRAVAVKVQYPRIVEALTIDLGHAAIIDKALSLFLRGQKRPVLIEEMRDRFLEECDYILEAKRQRTFAKVFAHREDMRIGEVVGELSGRRILTSELLEGAPVETFGAQASVAARDRAGSTVLDFYLESAIVHGIYNTDPNPGNFLFSERQVCFLDFGRVKIFSPGFVDQLKALLRATLERDRARVRKTLIAMGTVPDVDRYDFERAYHGMLVFHRPFLSDGRFRYDAEYLRKIWRVFVFSNPNMTRTNFTADMVFLNQFYFGVGALLVRLGASVNYRAKLLDMLYRPGEERPRAFSAAELALLDV